MAAHAAERRAGRLSARQHQADQLKRSARTRDQHAEAASVGATFRQHHGRPMRRRQATRSQEARAATAMAGFRQHHGLLRTPSKVAQAHHAIPPPPGRWWPVYEPPDLGSQYNECDGSYVPRPWWCWTIISVYGTPIDQPYCDLGGPPDTIAIPIRRIYTVTNAASMVRVSDGQDIACQAVVLSTDDGRYGWELTAQIPGKAALELARGAQWDPVEVDVTVNGYTWRILLDNWSLRETFDSHSATVHGRSRSAYLAAPYAKPRDHAQPLDRNALQLIAEELPPGWTQTYTMQDWLVPGGAWSYAQQTPIQAIQRIVTAGGGILQTHRTQDRLLIMPRYATAPWAWAGATPDVQLPRDFITQRGASQMPGDGTNGVYVHGGQTGGILALVKRLATAGDILAPTVVEDLMTHPDAARHRGIVALAETQRRAEETHELPLSAAYGGLLEVGQLLQVGEGDPFVEEWRGLITGTTVSARAAQARNGGAALSVRQQIKVERHHG